MGLWKNQNSYSLSPCSYLVTQGLRSSDCPLLLSYDPMVSRSFVQVELESLANGIRYPLEHSH